MYELLTVLICVGYKYLSSMLQKRKENHFNAQMKDLTPYVTPINPEVEALQKRKKEI